MIRYLDCDPVEICGYRNFYHSGMWKGLFRQPLPLPHLSLPLLPLPTEPGLYLIHELADMHDYQNQQFTIYKGTLLIKMIT